MLSKFVATRKPLALSLSKGSSRRQRRDEGFDRLSPNGV